MTKKETLQAEYKKIIGEDAPDTHTIKDLELSIKMVTIKDATNKYPELGIKDAEPRSSTAARLVNITNGRITKNVTNAQWRGMQDFKHDWKTKVNEPIEVQKLKKDA